MPCQPGVCDYSLDVRGGWYDAGDHGKYVVNGGISVYQLMSEFERTKVAPTAQPAKLGDTTLAMPESGNGVPDVLDEARWELEFLLSMQVPAGKPLAGMAHHKIHDENWTGLPLLPSADPQQRELHPPSTAATLNLAATAAQAARLFAPYDAAFAARCLTRGPHRLAAAAGPPGRLRPGLRRHRRRRLRRQRRHRRVLLGGGRAVPHHRREAVRRRGHRLAAAHGRRVPPDGFDWRCDGAAPGRLDLATVPNNLPGRAAVRGPSVLAGADKYLATLAAHPYGLPYAPDAAACSTGAPTAWCSTTWSSSAPRTT